MDQDETTMVKIFVFMPDEAVNVWRPIDAERISGDLFRIVSPDPDPEDEIWEFKSGEIVRCEERAFEDGVRGLAVVARVEQAV